MVLSGKNRTAVYRLRGGSPATERRERIEPVNWLRYTAPMPHRTKEENVAGVLAWRRRAKLRLIEAFGGGCGICGYNRCAANMAFHHLDPSQKGVGFGSAQSRSWAKVIHEVRKCVMLCHNCHGEYHAGLITDLSACPRFDETCATYSTRPTKGKTRRTGGLGGNRTRPMTQIKSLPASPECQPIR
jgi:hypothetical protein